ncbi:MAG: hypothetical protein L6R40_007066 [Gallowayella cf. fulva]|nr:MAG: hypothetical protein L6R40_007066 [Xanthomendoza cf. fulva]
MNVNDREGSALLPPWQPENPPDGFVVSFNYNSRARDLHKFDVWLGLVINIARLGINPWDRELEGRLDFPASTNFLLQGFSSGVAPRFQVKSMIWTLQAAFEEYTRRGQYSSASLVTRLNGHPLGFTNIKGNLVADRQTNSVIPSQVGRRGLDIRLDYTLDGAIFADEGFFYTLINLITYCANGDPKTQPTGGIFLYNSDEDYTVGVHPMVDDEAAREDLPLSRVIQILGTLPQKMFDQSRQAKWAELKGVAKFDGVNIGRVKIQKGQHVPDSCIIGNRNSTS